MLAKAGALSAPRQIKLQPPELFLTSTGSASSMDDGERTPPWSASSGDLAEENKSLRTQLLSLTFRCNDLDAEVSELEDQLSIFEAAAAAPSRRSGAVANTVIAALQQELRAANEEDGGLRTSETMSPSRGGGGGGDSAAAAPLARCLERAFCEVLDEVTAGTATARRSVSRSPPSRRPAIPSPPATPPRSYRALPSTNGDWLPSRAASERVGRRGTLGGCERSPPRRGGGVAAQNSARQGHGAAGFATAAAGARRGSAGGEIGEDEEALHCRILAKAYSLRHGKVPPPVDAVGELMELKKRYSAATGKWLKTDFMDAEELRTARRRVIEVLGEKKELLCAAAAATATATTGAASASAATTVAAAKGASSGKEATAAAAGGSGEAFFAERDETIAVLGGALELLRYRQLLDLLDAALRAGKDKDSNGSGDLRRGSRRAPTDGSSPQIEAA